MLKRHVDHHSQYSTPRRTLVACTSCHERKLRCDNNTPCVSCSRSSILCSRSRSDEPGEGTNQNISVEINTGCDNLSGKEIATLNGIPNVRPLILRDLDPNIPPDDTDSHQSWLGTAEDAWTLSPSLFSDLSSSNLEPWLVDQSEGAFTDCFDTFGSNQALSHDMLSLMPSYTGPPLTTSPSSTPIYEMETAPTSLGSLSRSTVSPSSVQEDKPSDLESYLETNNLANTNLLETYFMEVHPFWPILHPSTFDRDKAPHILTGVMILLARLSDEHQSNLTLTQFLFDEVNTLLVVRPIMPTTS